MQILALAGIILFKIKIKVDDFTKAFNFGEGVVCDPSASTLVPQELRWRRNILVCPKLISLHCLVVLADRLSVECCFYHPL